MPNSSFMRSSTIRRCSSPIPRSTVSFAWALNSTFTLGSSVVSLCSASDIFFSWPRWVSSRATPYMGAGICTDFMCSSSSSWLEWITEPKRRSSIFETEQRSPDTAVEISVRFLPWAWYKCASLTVFRWSPTKTWSPFLTEPWWTRKVASRPT